MTPCRAPRSTLLGLMLAGCCGLTDVEAASPPAMTDAKSVETASPMPATDVQARARMLLQQMTVEEKAGQLSQYFYIGSAPPLARALDARIAGGQVGALLFVTQPAEVNRLQRIALERSRLKIPLLFGLDVIHGFHTILPVPIALAASWDPAMVERAQGVAAVEARASGVHWTFAPMVDISRDPRWGRRVEGAGEDPYLGSAMAAAQVRGFQGPMLGTPGRIIAGPKHLAGYGAATGGRDYDEAEVSTSELWNVYLPPFKAAVDAGAGNIMTAYMALNGVPATADRWLVTDVLRRTWGFKGFVVSDADAVSSLTTHGLTRDGGDAAVRAIRAGVDMEMITPVGSAVMPQIPAEIAAGRLTVAELDAAVLPILEAKFRLGLFEHPYVDEAAATRANADPQHAETARIAAERSAVLLRNEGALLPLDRRHVRSLAVIGPLADSARDMLGPWVLAPRAAGTSVLAGLRAKLGDDVRLDYVEGVRLPERVFPSPFAAMDPRQPRPALDEAAGIARAVAAAKGADVAVLVLGEGQDMSGEQASRASLDLPGRQQELLQAVVATGKPTVVLLMSARPLSLHDAGPDAVLDIWYPGSEGGAAVANLLFGDASPGGKLPFTWIRSAAQAPATYARMVPHDAAKGYNRYWDDSSEPTYPFGHGLGYTTFAYSNLRVERAAYALGDTVRASVDVANTGQRGGDEVAQLYIHQRSGTSTRPIRELKGFRRITLKPGEKRTLTFSLTPDDLRYWSEATRGWVQDAATFDVWVGGSSAATLAGSFSVNDKPTR